MSSRGPLFAEPPKQPDFTRVKTFDVDPLPLMRALADGRLPDEPGEPGEYEIELTPEGPLTGVGVDVAALREARPFH